MSAAVKNLREEHLDASERPGDWSIRQVLHHLADAELMRAVRLYQMLVEDNPTIYRWDQEAFPGRLHYDHRDITPSIAVFTALRTSLVSTLERLSAEEWQRSGLHWEIEPFTVETLIQRGIYHVRDHLDQIERARSRIGDSHFS